MPDLMYAGAAGWPVDAGPAMYIWVEGRDGRLRRRRLVGWTRDSLKAAIVGAGVDEMSRMGTRSRIAAINAMVEPYDIDPV